MVDSLIKNQSYTTDDPDIDLATAFRDKWMDTKEFPTMFSLIFAAIKAGRALEKTS